MACCYSIISSQNTITGSPHITNRNQKIEGQDKRDKKKASTTISLVERSRSFPTSYIVMTVTSKFVVIA